MKEPRGLEARSGSASLALFLQAGACFGFFDLVAARTQSALPLVDGLVLYTLPIAAFGVLGAGAALIEILIRRFGEARRPLWLSWLAMAACLVPIALQGLRGCIGNCGFSTAQGLMLALPATLVLAVVLIGHHRRFAKGPQGTFLLLILSITGLSTLTFEQRFDVAGAFLPPFLGPFVLWGLFGGAVTAWLTSRLGSLFAPIAGLFLVATVATVTSGAAQTVPGPAMDRRSKGTPDPAASNILLIVLDCARADRLPPTPMRPTRTPVLDNFARSSYVFSRAIANGNYSLSSHASLFTGVLPSEHGAHTTFQGSGRGRLHDPLDPAIVTEAERLSAAGFSTLGVSANYVFLAPWTGLQRGFQSFDDRPKRVSRSSPLGPILLIRLADLVGPPFQPLLLYRPAVEIREAVERALEGTEAPFFAFVNLMDAHEPRVPRTPRWPGSFSAGRKLSYDDSIEYLDSELGRLFAWMDRRGLLRTTFLVVTSDHGEFLGEYGLWGHQQGVSQAMVHVPLLIRPPGGLPATVTIDQPFGLHRVLPLIRNGKEGFSNLNLPAPEPELLAEAWGAVGGPTTGLPDQRAVFFGNLKLIAGRNGQRLLFDLDKDPRERRDIWKTVGSSLTSRFEAAARKRFRETRSNKPALDSEALERMRSLGYLGPGR